MRSVVRPATWFTALSEGGTAGFPLGTALDACVYCRVVDNQPKKLVAIGQAVHITCLRDASRDAYEMAKEA